MAEVLIEVTGATEAAARIRAMGARAAGEGLLTALAPTVARNLARRAATRPWAPDAEASIDRGSLGDLQPDPTARGDGAGDDLPFRIASGDAAVLTIGRTTATWRIPSDYSYPFILNAGISNNGPDGAKGSSTRTMPSRRLLAIDQQGVTEITAVASAIITGLGGTTTATVK